MSITLQQIPRLVVLVALAAPAIAQESPPPAAGNSLESKFDKTVIEYVNSSLLRENDKNGDGFLDSAEWARVNWSRSNPPENSDLNKDGMLSREELCVRISTSRRIPIKGEQPPVVDSLSPHMLSVLKPGQWVHLAKTESSGFGVIVYSDEDAEKYKKSGVSYQLYTVKRISSEYIVLTQTSTRNMREYQRDRFIAAHAIDSITIERELGPAKDTP